jgi:pyrophosphatase PpaX
MTIKAVLFDLDDTLLDSLKARVKALEHVFADTGITNIKADEFLFNLQGNPFVTGLKELALARGIHDDLFVKYRRAYWFNSQDSLQLYPGVRRLLEKLKTKGFKLGIVTSKMHDTVFEGSRIGCALELEKMGIGDLFAVVIGLEDVQKPKPDPECVHLALSKTSIVPGNTLVVGDSAADMAAAKAAGCISCHAAWGISETYSPPEKIAADFVASEPGDIISIIARCP